MRTETIKIYKLEELSEEVQEKVIEKKYDINLHHEWWESIYEMYMQDETGFDIDKIYFSGFWSQGDGAMFEGSPNKDILNFITPNYRNEAYQKDWSRVIKLIKNGDINIYGSFKQSGHYYHSKSYSDNLDAEMTNDWYGKNYSNIEDILEDILEEIREYYEDVCNKIYHSLEQEQEHYSSREAIEETIISNDYEFTEDGEQY
tara:strand:+ start:332 stop:937 length:606 start_codon:yes stop_codon:yes gene_type:complete